MRPSRNRESERANEWNDDGRRREEGGWRAGEKIDRSVEIDARRREINRGKERWSLPTSASGASQPGVDQPPPLDTHLLPRDALVCLRRANVLVRRFAVVRNARMENRQEKRKKKREKRREPFDGSWHSFDSLTRVDTRRVDTRLFFPLLFNSRSNKYNRWISIMKGKWIVG